MELSDQQLEMCESSQWDFSDLHALFLNCTLKKSPEMSHTQGLVEISKAIMGEKRRFRGGCAPRRLQHCLWSLSGHDEAGLGAR